MKKIIIPALCLAFFAGCQSNAPKNGSQADEPLVTEYKASPLDTVTVEKRLNAQTKNFVFKAKESFDRCDAVTVERRDGKPMKLTPEFKQDLDCVHYTAEIVDDRFLAFMSEKQVLLYDLEKNTQQLLFVPQPFSDANLSCLGWSPDKSRVAFVSTAYEPEAQKRLGYPTRTRIIVLQFNADKSAIALKTKYDVGVQFMATEGDYVARENCFWANNSTLRYRKFVSEDYETVEKAKKEYENLDITK